MKTVVEDFGLDHPKTKFSGLFALIPTFSGLTCGSPISHEFGTLPFWNSGLIFSGLIGSTGIKNLFFPWQYSAQDFHLAHVFQFTIKYENQDHTMMKNIVILVMGIVTN